MLVKIKEIDDANKTIKVTLLDIDELGSVIPMRDLDLRVLPGDSYIINLLKASTHAIIFTEDFSNKNNSVVITALNLTDDELNDEKERMIKTANRMKVGQ